MKHRSSDGLLRVLGTVALATFALHYCSSPRDSNPDADTPLGTPDSTGEGSPPLPGRPLPDYGARAMGCLGSIEPPAERRDHSPDDMAQHFQTAIDNLNNCVGDGEGVTADFSFGIHLWHCAEGSEFRICRIRLESSSTMPSEDDPEAFDALGNELSRIGYTPLVDSTLSVDCNLLEVDPSLFFPGYEIEFTASLQFLGDGRLQYDEYFWTADPNTSLTPVGPGGLRIEADQSLLITQLAPLEGPEGFEETLNFVQEGGAEPLLFQPNENSLAEPASGMRALLDELKELSDEVDEGVLRRRIEDFSLVKNDETL